MKCPHCEYVEGYDPDSMKVVEGEKGKFYTFPIEAKRDSVYGGYSQEISVYVCPSCSKLFGGI